MPSIEPVSFYLEVNTPGGSKHIVEIEGTDGNLNRIGLEGLSFTAIDPRPVTLFLIDDHWEVPDDRVPPDLEPVACADGTCLVNRRPDLNDIVATLEGLRTYVPIPDRIPLRMQWVSLSHPGSGISEPPEWNGEVTQTLIDALGDSYTDDDRNFAIMLFSSRVVDPDPSLSGCAWGSAGTGVETLFSAAACPDTVAHEAMHTLGVSHVSLAHGEAEGGGGVER